MTPQNQVTEDTVQSSVFEHSSYRTYLRSVLAERITRNPSYSLRAMAKALGLQASHLSSIHSGQKRLSAETAMKVAVNLGLGKTETEYFTLLVQYENAREPELKHEYQQRLSALNSNGPVRDLSIDAFKMIADWYHIPILEMTNLTSVNVTPALASKKLGISTTEAQVALERLERLELIERDEKGRYAKVHGNAVFKAELPNLALRHFHKQMLEKATISLETQSPKEKYIGSQTFPIDLAQLESAKPIIEKFRRELVDHFIKGKRKTHVYHLGVQLFNLTKENVK